MSARLKEKKQPGPGMKSTGLPNLPIPNEILTGLPACKISNLRFTVQASPSESPPPDGLDTPDALNLKPDSQFKVRRRRERCSRAFAVFWKFKGDVTGAQKFDAFEMRVLSKPVVVKSRLRMLQ